MAFSVSIACAVAANVICSILLVLVNKTLVLKFHFDYMILLTALHFLASFSLCLFSTITGCSKYKTVNNYLSIFRISMVSCIHPSFINNSYIFLYSFTVGLFDRVRSYL